MRKPVICLRSVFSSLLFTLASDGQAGSGEIAPGVPAVDFPRPSNRDEWERRRQETRDTLWRLLGDLPPRPEKIDAKTTERKHYENVPCERIAIDNGAGEMIPGYLCLPEKQSEPAPALLYCHQHGEKYDVGKDEIFRTDPMPEAPALRLTREGFVVLAIDAACFGERQGRGPLGGAETGKAGELTLSKLNLWLGRTLWGMMVRDDRIALDYLSERPEVDPARIGVMGLSMGSTRAWWLAALDERIAVTVALACLTRYQDLIANGRLCEHGIYYYVPGMLKHFDTEAVLSLIAPRPLLTLTGDRDAGSPARGAHKINAFCEAVYAMYGEPAAFVGRVLPGVGHECTPEMWRESIAWLHCWLDRPRRSVEVSPDRPV